jgi:hypothetical protein
MLAFVLMPTPTTPVGLYTHTTYASNTRIWTFPAVTMLPPLLVPQGVGPMALLRTTYGVAYRARRGRGLI